MFMAAVLLILTLLWFSKWLFYLVIGCLTAALFCYDKQAAIKRRWRVPEKRLLFASFLGGAPFALVTIFMIRHKSSKPGIYIPVIIFTGIHIFLLIVSCNFS